MYTRRTMLALTATAAAGPLDPGRSRAIVSKMQEMIDRGEIPGAVTMVLDREGVAHAAATGYADPGRTRAMKQDSIFWIASMTKPVAAAAIMMLADEGKLAVEDEAAKFIPELGALKTQAGSPARVTMLHMLTHTSGMAEATPEESRRAVKLADLIPAFASKPLGFEPGSRWRYCQSGINTLGRIVEVVSGQSLPDFLDRRFFRPLGMKDTTFYLAENQMPRLVTPAARKDGALVEAPNRFLAGRAPTSRDRYPAANGGLFSTAADYGRFVRMMLNEGALDGRRYLKKETVRRIAAIHTGELVTGFTPGNGWGLGVCVVREPQGVTSALSRGSYGHGGAYGTQAWIDPVKGAGYILMVQRSDFPNSDGSDVRSAFQQAAAS